MLVSPSTCFFPLEALTPTQNTEHNNNTISNKITLTYAPPAAGSATNSLVLLNRTSEETEMHFTVRATHQYEIEVTPNAGVLTVGVPLELTVKWVGNPPTDVVTYAGLRPQKQPKLRIDASVHGGPGPAASTPPVILPLVFTFPSAEQLFNYTLDGEKWFTNCCKAQQQVPPAPATAPPQQQNDEQQQQPQQQQPQQFPALTVDTQNGVIISPDREPSTATLDFMSPMSTYTRSDVCIEAIAQRQATRDAWLEHLRSRNEALRLEVEAETRRRENSRQLQSELSTLKSMVSQSKTRLRQQQSNGNCVIS
eukprot:PhM_4_TR17230/c0_g1_i1/m.5646